MTGHCRVLSRKIPWSVICCCRSWRTMGACLCVQRKTDCFCCRSRNDYDVERQDLLHQQNDDEQRSNYRSNRSQVGELGISIYLGNLLDEHVDAIVCATTDNLSHSSGLAKAVADRAGYCVLQECQQFGRPLYTCEAMHTSSGHLWPQIKHVIHVGAPVAREYSNANDLRNAVVETFYNCLCYANYSLQVKSVAIPAMCTGHFGVSKRTAAEAACEAIRRFDDDVTRVRSITHVRFVNIDMKADKLFKETFQSSQRYPTARQFQLSLRRPEHHTPHTEMIEVSEAPVSVRPRERKLAKNHKADSGERPSPSVDSHAACSPGRAHLDDLTHDQVSERSKNEHTDADASGILVDIGPSTTYSSSPSNILRKPDEEDCVICMGTMTNPRPLPCGHSFCSDCIQQSFDKCGAKCPSCGRLYGVQRGNQPPGTMTQLIDFDRHLAGYYGHGTIAITYYFPDGIQNDDHPNPGQPYAGTHRTAFLPNNAEGQEVLGLLRQAFDAGLVFTIGRSVTSGADNVIVWNDIHHKTNDSGPYGYPDPTYLTRIKSELAAKGITLSN